MNSLINTFSEILTFKGSEGLSSNSKIRIEILSDKEADLSLALPDPGDPSMFYLTGVWASFVACLLPNFKGAEEFIQLVGVSHFGRGKTEDYFEKVPGGQIRVRYNRETFVYEFRITLQ